MTETGIIPAEFREVSEGRLTSNGLTYPLAPYLDGEPLRRYIRLKQQYSKILARDREHGGDLPATFEATAYCYRLVETHGSAEAQAAVRQGKLELLSYMTGLTHRKGDFSTAQLLQQLLNHLRRDGFLATFAGSTDGGKTNTALLLAELALLDDSDLVLATNVTSVRWNDPRLDERTVFVESKSELLDVVESYENVFAILDEMSTQANAQTSNYEVNDEFYPVVTFKSKYGLRMVIIGHRESGHDIAPAIREHSTFFVRQIRKENDLEDDVYRAEFYDGIEDGKPIDEQLALEPIPLASCTYNPDEKATFKIST